MIVGVAHSLGLTSVYHVLVYTESRHRPTDRYSVLSIYPASIAFASVTPSEVRSRRPHAINVLSFYDLKDRNKIRGAFLADVDGIVLCCRDFVGTA